MRKVEVANLTGGCKYLLTFCQNSVYSEVLSNYLNIYMLYETENLNYFGCAASGRSKLPRWT